MIKVKTKILNARTSLIKPTAYLLVVASGWYLFDTFNDKSNTAGGWEMLAYFASLKWILTGWFFGTANWMIRIEKWRFLASKIRKVSYIEAAFQQMSAYAWSFFTPFNSGEFIHKALFFDDKKQAVRRVFIEQVSQMLVTAWAGLAAGIFYAGFGEVSAFVLISGAVLMFFSSETWRKALLYSAVRYVVFGSFLFWVLFQSGMVKAEWNLLIHIPMYFLVISVVPLVPWFDFPVKTSIALWILTPEVPDKRVIFLLMLWLWIWNSFFPALTGQIWLINRLRKNEIC